MLPTAKARYVDVYVGHPTINGGAQGRYLSLFHGTLPPPSPSSASFGAPDALKLLIPFSAKMLHSFCVCVCLWVNLPGVLQVD